MKFIIRGEIIHNDVQTMAQVFFQNRGFELVTRVPDAGLCLEVANCDETVFAKLYVDGAEARGDAVPISLEDDKGINRAVKLAIFNVLAAYTGYRPPWGLLTGIRPAKIATGLIGRGFCEDEARDAFEAYYLVEPGRARLCVQVAAAQQGIVEGCEGAISIYIAVPFCPSICLYCSFSSYSVDKFGKYMDDYVAALCQEIEFLGKAVRDKRVENIYIGGGTPTALDDANFERLLAQVAESFDNAMAGVKEYSVEAGRPDTITEQKLGIMKKFGVGRISINTQSLNDATLTKIGRGHTAAQFFDAYNLACDAGFEHINIDLILGLAGEGPDNVRRTFEGICALEPKAVTVHTLAVKRASRLHQELGTLPLTAVACMEQMLEAAASYMSDANLMPYYLYRQKNSLGNFENIGYAAAGYEGRYNVQVMEERQSVYAAGAGAVSKLVTSRDDRIERIFNLRNPVEYIRRVDEMIERKGGLV